jgi:hypothetical protein
VRTGFRLEALSGFYEYWKGTGKTLLNGVLSLLTLSCSDLNLKTSE